MKTRPVVACPARTCALAGCCLLPVLMVVCLLYAHGLRDKLNKTALQVRQLQRTDHLARHFEPLYTTMAERVKSQRYPRVFWTDRLHNALADFSGDELSFSIADPVTIPVEFSGRVSNVLATEYLVQLSASLDGDASLMQLLNRLEGIDAEFLHARSCSVNRRGNSQPLRLDCAYSIVSLDQNKAS